MKYPVHKLADIYSSNAKVNSVIRTLLVQNGKDNLWRAVANFVDSEEGKTWTGTEIWILYQATKWVIFKEN